MTQRLLSLASRHWPSIDGSLAASLTTDPLRLPVDRFLNLIYWWATNEASAEDVRRFDQRLWMPPKGEAPAPQSPWSPENETKALSAFAAEVGVSGAKVANPAITQ